MTVSGVAYLRVSTDDQALGVEAQREAVRGYCAREGVELVGEHVDDGVSGAAPLDRRPGLLGALAALRRGGALVVAKRDRIARDPLVALLVERDAERRGARVLCADGNGNGDGAADVLLRRVLDAVSEFERAQIAMRTRAALHVKRCRGERISGVPPFGFAFEGGRLVEVEAEQAQLREARRLVGEGRSYGYVARVLGASARTGRAWRREGVFRMLGTAGRRAS